ncbi:hypothetical protein J3D47_002519 [Pseudomonas laurylsulfativorans]|nr:hypothetical protein [Pseudomonas laurylsulfativorans]
MPRSPRLSQWLACTLLGLFAGGARCLAALAGDDE